MRVLLIPLVFALGAVGPASRHPAVSPPSQRAAAAVRSAHPGAPRSAAADTMRARVRAGEPLLVSLPAPRGRDVRYRIVRAPALSWLVDRSFVWRTLADEAGQIDVVFRRERPGAEADTLVLVVEIAGASR